MLDPSEVVVPKKGPVAYVMSIPWKTILFDRSTIAIYAHTFCGTLTPFLSFYNIISSLLSLFVFILFFIYPPSLYSSFPVSFPFLPPFFPLFLFPTVSRPFTLYFPNNS